MLAGPTVRDDGSGNAVLIKHAAGAERLRLHHEAQVLAAARISGVVECVGLDEFEQRCELRLRYIEAATLAEQPPLGPHDAFDVLIELGTTLAELHARGIRHGALRSDHVLLARPCRPVLCGFGEATGPGDESQHPPGADLAALAALATSELTRADPMAGEAAERRSCADALMAAKNLAIASGSARSDSEPLTEWLVCMQHIRDASRRQQPAAIDGFGPARPLVTAFAPDSHDLRERLRAQVTADVPSDANVNGSLSGSRSADRRMLSAPERRRVLSYAATAVALAVAAIIGWRALTGDGPYAEAPGVLIPSAATPIEPAGPARSGAEPAQPDGVAASAGADSSYNDDDNSDGLRSSTALSDTGSTAPASVPVGATLLYSTGQRTAPADCPDAVDSESRPAPGAQSEPDGTYSRAGEPIADAKVATHRADVRGDGCPVPVHIEMPAADRPTAAVYSPDGDWTVGTLDDLIAIGDWDCDGRATVAIIGTTTGVVSFFGSWPRTNQAVAPARTAHVPRQATAVSVITPVGASVGTAPSGASGNEDRSIACDELVVHYGDMSLTLARHGHAADTAAWLRTK